MYNITLLLLYITSSPSNFDLREVARSTYLSHCIPPICIYKFFIDVSLLSPPSYEYIHMNSSSFIKLENEYKKYNDIIFKDECILMNQRHQDNRINYANSAPTLKNIHFINNNTFYDNKHGNITKNYIPDYKYRRMYKIDWKVCFLQWANNNNYINAIFHAFIEDDSFVCIDHVLYQANLYQNSNNNNNKPFRTGTRLWSGYDDSFTLLSKEVALIFALYYPSNGFNCSHIVDSTQYDVLDKSLWLSWGNSWIHERCNWTNALKEIFKIDIIEPSIDCFQSVFNYDKNIKYNGINPYDENISNDYPCSKYPIVYHHAHAMKMLIHLNYTLRSHICNRMMFIDKIKDPLAIEYLWAISIKNTNTSNYFNLTQVFNHDGAEGWKILLDDYNRKEK